MTDSPTSIRVVKVGGSLFDDGLLQQKLDQWVARADRQRPRQTVWVVGGGKFVDCVRDWQKTHVTDGALADHDAHWIAVDLLTQTAKLFWGLFPSAMWIEDLSHVAAHRRQAMFVFSCARWLKDVGGLPENWQTTSDSIALSAAYELKADELILMKSASAVSDRVQANVEAGILDRHFSQLYQADRSLAIRVVNLRGEGNHHGKRLI